MIIDSKNYSGICNCGREHRMETEFCIIEKGCMKDIDAYIAKYNLGGLCAAIYDDNTYNAQGLVRPSADKEIILPSENLHANGHIVELAMKEIPENCNYLIAVGSGTVHDITKYCAYLKKIPFVSCPTAASVDGFCSPVAAMTWDGCKKPLTAVAPTIVVADLDIISKAPIRLTKSGFGNMTGKYIALADWRIANVLTGEYFCQRIHDMTMQAAKSVIESTEGIKSGEISAYEKLTYGLLISGLAMQLLGNSRCASGAEHHISHIIEMQSESSETASDALHGEKVGVGTLIACREYHRLAGIKNPCFTDYTEIKAEYIESIFGERLSPSIIAENVNDCAEGITGASLSGKWEDICKIVKSVPVYGDLLDKYFVLGAKNKLSDIGVPADLEKSFLNTHRLCGTELLL